jgi:hypothetical protein
MKKFLAITAILVAAQIIPTWIAASMPDWMQTVIATTFVVLAVFVGKQMKEGNI